MGIAVDHMELRYRRSDVVGPWTDLIVAPGQQSVTLTGLERGFAYQVEARNIGINGAASAWVQQTHTVAQVTVTAVQPSSLGAVTEATGVYLHWTISGTAEPDTSYEIQVANDVSAAPDASTWADIDFTGSLNYLDERTDSTWRWYRVRATDSEGYQSAWTAAVRGRANPSSGGSPGA